MEINLIPEHDFIFGGAIHDPLFYSQALTRITHKVNRPKWLSKKLKENIFFKTIIINEIHRLLLRMHLLKQMLMDRKTDMEKVTSAFELLSRCIESLPPNGKLLFVNNKFGDSHIINEINEPKSLSIIKQTLNKSTLTTRLFIMFLDDLCYLQGYDQTHSHDRGGKKIARYMTFQEIARQKIFKYVTTNICTPMTLSS